MSGSLTKFFVVTALVVVTAAAALWLTRREGWWPEPGPAAQPVRDTALLGTLPALLRESSGIAISRTQPGVVWTHNDSGDDAVLYAIRVSGEVMARFAVDGVAARDWEDVAAGPCPDAAAESCLYVADTGDNRARRGVYQIVIVPEPPVEPETSMGRARGRVVPFVYPDGVHDAEALAVTPEGDAVLVTRARYRRSGMYALTAEQLGAGATGQVVARYLGSPGIAPGWHAARVVTGAALTADGTTLALRTPSEVYLFAFHDGVVGEMRTRCVLGDLEPQGEAVDFFADGTLLLVSEARGARAGTVYRARCP